MAIMSRTKIASWRLTRRDYRAIRSGHGTSIYHRWETRGAAALAESLAVHRSRVHASMRAKGNGGTGGTIPQKHHLSILRLAKERGIEITAYDLLPREIAEAAQ